MTPLMRVVGCWLAIAVIGQLCTRASAAEDLRDKFGTKSTAAAKHLDVAIRLVESNRPAEALPLLDQSLAADAELQLAYC